MARNEVVFVFSTIALALAVSITHGQTANPPTQAVFDHASAVSASVRQIEHDATASGDFSAAAASAERLLAHVTAYAPVRQSRAFVEAAFAARHYRFLAAIPQDDAKVLHQFLGEHTELAQTLAFLVSPDEQPQAVYATLKKLSAARGEQLAKYPALVAALCVVHDQPIVHHINENRVEAPDVVALFDFYVEHEKRLLYGLTKLPAELLVWTVDSTSPIEEMEWAVGKFAGNRKVGSLFFEIEYDYDHLRKGKPKKVTQAGFSLPNILKYGGVCVDQAYFAVMVGKSIGVPTAMVSAQGAEVGHAWVGFFQTQGRRGRWNFDVGRYSAYQGIRGNAEDPQTRRTIPDSYVSVLAELIGTRTADRWAAAAFTDAAVYLGNQAEDFRPKPIDRPADDAPPLAPRINDAETQLRLLEAGLRRTPGYGRAWFAIRNLAAQGRMGLSDKKKWAGLLQQMCGRAYPDFTLAILRPMIKSIESPREQLRLWDAAARIVTSRADLSAEVRIAQGQAWEALDEPAKAGQCYEDVIRRFANDGPFVITALAKTEQMLKAAGKPERVVRLYASAWQSIRPPSQMAGVFATQSNYYQVGMIYADKLAEAGFMDEAEQTRAEIKKTTGV
jgi:hypothetical protein